MMKIGPNVVVLLRCTLSTPDGDPIGVPETFSYLHGGYGGVLAALEAQLKGHTIGDELCLELPPAEAFGEYDPLLVRVEPRDNTPGDVAVGSILTDGAPARPGGRALNYRALEVNARDVVLDANHPYAGKAIILHCEVLAVRSATADEIAQGRPST
jgi:FKBP-type peptidyl-prolyl cis-trans isomerase SlyD